MREIEIKARVADKDVLIDTLKTNGVELTVPVLQHDRVYGIPGVAGDSENTNPWLRIREEAVNGETTTYFTLKKSVTNQMDSIEHEVIAGDPVALEGIVQELGFVPYSDLTKVRQKAHLSDDIEICVDTVEPLGHFIEAEKLSADEVDYDEVITELWRILAPFGVTHANEVTDGYDVLMNKHLGKE